MMWRAQIIAPTGETEWRMLEASSREAAVMRLAADGLTPVELRTGQPTLAEILQQPVNLSFGLPAQEQALLLRQLATLVGSGIPVDRSLDLLGEQSSHKLSGTIARDMLVRVRQGGSLGAALEDAKAFPAYVAGVVRAAERGGRLDKALASIADRLELTASTRRQLITSLSYPAAILVATIGALLLVLIGVVPQFQPLFEGEEARLPLLTQAVLGLSNLAVNHAASSALGCVAVVLLIVVAARTPSVQEQLSPFVRRLPFMKLRDQYLSAQFSSLLGTLLGNGLTLVEALPLARETLSAKRWKAFLMNVEKDVRGGHRLSSALARGGLLPSTVIRLIEVGEQTGKISETSLQAGNILAEAVRARIERILSLVNPLAIVSLGGLVGMLVAGVMLGIFAMGDFAG